MKNKELQTAEDIALRYDTHLSENHLTRVRAAMIEFAELHVEAALKSAFNNSEMRVSENDTDEYPSFTDNYDDGYVTITVSKDSILNAYPLDNIK